MVAKQQRGENKKHKPQLIVSNISKHPINNRARFFTFPHGLLLLYRLLLFAKALLIHGLLLNKHKTFSTVSHFTARYSWSWRL